MKLDRDKLIRAREMLGYSVEKTAEEAGVSKNSVLRAEHEDDIRPLTARKIATALGVRVADLIGESETLKVQPPLPNFNRERHVALAQLFDGLRTLITDTAARWMHAAESGAVFWSEDAAIAYSIEVNTAAAQLYGFVGESLEPSLEELLSGTLTLRDEQRKLLEAMDQLNKAVDAANAAADAVAPPREPTDEEWAAAIPILEQLWEEMDEVKQRRLLRECAEEMAAECEQAAAALRGRIA